jgi:acetyl-CoA acetyltransferase
MKDIGLVELNEAFAAQVLACLQAFSSDSLAMARLGLRSAPGAVDPAILNVNGGAIALGHPVGASGARLLLTLALEMAEREVESGLAAACVGGGQGTAFILQRTSYTR